MNAWWMPMRSASTPCSSGMIAPPTMAQTSKAEPLPVNGPRPLNRDSKDAREHRGIKEPNEQDAPHRQMSEAAHREPHQQKGHQCGKSQYSSGADFLQHSRSDESANHRTAPVKGNKFRGQL